MLVCLFLVAFTTSAALAQQTSLYSCNRAWQTQYRCLESGVQRRDENDATYPVPNNGDKNRIRNDVDSCFKKARCRSSPFPSNQEMNARRTCFQDSKRQLDQDLDTCMRASRKISNWNNPIDSWPQQDMDEWAYVVKRVSDAQNNPRDYCDNSIRSQDMKQCISQKTSFNFNQRPSRGPPSYWCEADAECWYDVGPDCQRMWEDRVTPVLCDCSNKMKNEGRLRRAQDDYRQCMSRRVNQQLANDDPGANWLAEYVSDMCQNWLNRPCQSQRKDYERNRNSRRG